MTVTLFTQKSCAPCQTIKKYLQMRGVEYSERDALEDNSIVELTGRFITPTVLVENNGKKTVVTGMNIPSLAKALDLS